MSKTKNDKNQYRKYLSGEMGQEEAHAFERDTLSDAFEQEALEGLEGINADQAFADIEKLQKRVLSRPIQIGWMKIAAAVALLVVSSISVWLIVRPIESQQELAMETEKVEEKLVREDAASEEVIDPTAGNNEGELLADQTPPAKPSVSNVPEAENFLTQEESRIDEAVSEIEPEEDAVESLTRAESEIIEEPAFQDDRDQLDRTLAGKAASVSISGNNEVPTDKKDVDEDLLIAEEVVIDATEGFAAKSEQTGGVEESEESRRGKAKKRKEAPAASRAMAGSQISKVSGQIVDENGEALPGVNVVVKGTTTGTTTDLDGNYVISIDPNAVLVVSYVGFTTQEVQTSERKNIDITLNQDNDGLAEVVVTGYGGDESVTTFSPAKPLIGNKAYKEQIETNLRYPEAAITNEIEGTVVLDVTISGGGEVINVVVKKSLGYGCDEEAIRLVELGPRWSPAERDGANVEDKVRVRVKFKMADR